MADNFLLKLLAGTAEVAEIAGIEEALSALHAKDPVKYKTVCTLLVGASTAFAELEAVTNSGFLKKLEEGFIIAVTESIAKNPL